MAIRRTVMWDDGPFRRRHAARFGERERWRRTGLGPDLGAAIRVLDPPVVGRNGRRRASDDRGQRADGARGANRALGDGVDGGCGMSEVKPDHS